MKTPVPRILRRLALLLPLVVLAPPAYLTVQGLRIAHGLLHPPRVPVERPAAERAFTGLEDVTFPSADGLTLRGWYVPSRNHAAVVLVHGFAANRAQLLFEARVLADAGYGVLLFDLRAQGASDGDTITWGDRERGDITAALDFVSARPDVDRARVGLFGFSMGGTTALLVAQADPRVRAVAVAGAFPTLVGDIHSCYGRWGQLSSLPVVWGLRGAGIDVDAVRPIDGMCRLEGRPLLLVNGDTDPDGPQKLDASLYRAACEPKTLRVVPGAGHGEYALKVPEGYARDLRSLFDRALLRDSHR